MTEKCVSPVNMSYLKFTKRNIRRTPFQAIAASMVMFLTFFVLLLFLVLAYGSQEVLRYYESKPQVIAFFKDGTTDQDIRAITNVLETLPSVSKVAYVSKEEALEIYRLRNQNDPILLELVTANILPASLEVSTVDPQNLASVAEVLKREPVVSEVIVPEDVVQTLTSATTIIRVVGGATVVFLILFSTLVILMIIGFKIRLKRDEIEIMRLVGASSSFIRTPFILEGVFYGLIGAITAWVSIFILIWSATPYLQEYLGEVNVLPIRPLFMLVMLFIGSVVAVIIGALGSLGAVRRYLHF